MKIILLGYMSCGKSTIGKILSKFINIDFIDLDDFIEEKYNSSLTEIFKTKGELFFRKIERLALLELLGSRKPFVLSLGGGTPCYYDNMDLLLETEKVKSFYLKSSLPKLVNRLEIEKEQRPLISHLDNKEVLTEFIGKHLFERSFFYNKAHFVIENDGDIEVVVEAIVAKLY
ncbi:shikimate kinase [Aurantibacter sp.]|uniref:shikimate kinase n=1 Tax=Aurantibacter sp. TaxID=2807103 RepID=UPI0035C80AEE